MLIQIDDNEPATAESILADNDGNEDVADVLARIAAGEDVVELNMGAGGVFVFRRDRRAEHLAHARDLDTLADAESDAHRATVLRTAAAEARAAAGRYRPALVLTPCEDETPAPEPEPPPPAPVQLRLGFDLGPLFDRQEVLA